MKTKDKAQYTYAAGAILILMILLIAYFKYSKIVTHEWIIKDNWWATSNAIITTFSWWATSNANSLNLLK
jgi:hypothetical protein